MGRWGKYCSCSLEISSQGREDYLSTACQVDDENLVAELVFLYRSENCLVSLGFQLHFADTLSAWICLRHPN